MERVIGLNENFFCSIHSSTSVVEHSVSMFSDPFYVRFELKHVSRVLFIRIYRFNFYRSFCPILSNRICNKLFLISLSTNYFSYICR